MSRLIVRYDDFSKGEAGWVDKAKIPTGFFTGENVVPFRDGSIGPRSGALDLAPTGIPAGTFRNMGYVDLGNSGPEWVWIHKGTKIARVQVYNNAAKVLLGQAFANAAGPAVGDFPSDAVEYDPRITYITVYSDQTYSVDWSAGANGTITPVAGSPGAGCIEIFDLFLVTGNGGSGSTRGRLQFSKAGDFSTWPAANFIDLKGGGVGGAIPAIVALKTVKDQLLVWTETGQVYVITGKLDNHPTIREFEPGDMMTGPAWAQTPVRARDGSVWWTRREETVFADHIDHSIATAMPVSYLGGTLDEYPQMGGWLRQLSQLSNRASSSVGVIGRTKRSVVLAAAGRFLIMRDGVWSRHRWTANDLYRVTEGGRGDLYTMDVTGATLHAWLFELERPPWRMTGSATHPLPYATTDAGGAYNPDGAWFATPEHRTVDFSNVAVARIDVCFTAHETGDNVNSHLEVLLEQYDVSGGSEKVNPAGGNSPFDRDDTAGVMNAGGVSIGCTTDASGAYTPWDAAPDASFDYRKRVSFFPLGGSPKPAPAIRVACRALRGVSIHEIAVFGDVLPPDKV